MVKWHLLNCCWFPGRSADQHVSALTSVGSNMPEIPATPQHSPFDNPSIVSVSLLFHLDFSVFAMTHSQPAFIYRCIISLLCNEFAMNLNLEINGFFFFLLPSVYCTWPACLSFVTNNVLIRNAGIRVMYKDCEILIAS